MQPRPYRGPFCPGFVFIRIWLSLFQRFLVVYSDFVGAVVNDVTVEKQIFFTGFFYHGRHNRFCRMDPCPSQEGKKMSFIPLIKHFLQIVSHPDELVLLFRIASLLKFLNVIPPPCICLFLLMFCKKNRPLFFR